MSISEKSIKELSDDHNDEEQSQFPKFPQCDVSTIGFIWNSNLKVTIYASRCSFCMRKKYFSISVSGGGGK